jgi:hypothetical protein
MVLPKLQIKKNYPHFYHKTDKFGRPVYYELLGELNLSALLKVVSVDRLVRLHARSWETTRQTVFPACSFVAGRDIFTCTTVLDMKGVKLTSFTKEVRDFIAQISSIDQVSYHR